MQSSTLAIMSLLQTLQWAPEGSWQGPRKRQEVRGLVLVTLRAGQAQCSQPADGGSKFVTLGRLRSIHSTSCNCPTKKLTCRATAWVSSLHVGMSPSCWQVCNCCMSVLTGLLGPTRCIPNEVAVWYLQALCMLSVGAHSSLSQLRPRKAAGS